MGDLCSVIPWDQKLRDARRGLEIHNQVLAYAHATRNFGGRYRWMLDVAPYIDRSRPPPRTIDAFAPQLLQLRLTVLWGEGGPRERLQLQSLRLVQPDMSGTVP